MSEFDEEFGKVIAEYREKFGKVLVYPEDLPVGTPEEWIEQIRQCIDTGTPYKFPKSDLPEGCIV